MKSFLRGFVLFCFPSSCLWRLLILNREQRCCRHFSWAKHMMILVLCGNLMPQRIPPSCCITQVGVSPTGYKDFFSAVPNNTSIATGGNNFNSQYKSRSGQITLSGPILSPNKRKIFTLWHRGTSFLIRESHECCFKYLIENWDTEAEKKGVNMATANSVHSSLRKN